MIKIRIEVPRREELPAALARVGRGFDVISVSEPYENRNGNGYRVYIEAEIPLVCDNPKGVYFCFD